ncbi:10058_t:CDS:2 [Paraglomus occultum]|uniref:10058_t:CDS:1 n=1 Tax=Paraglomus occultum TaxID=144539 RepID=A0A9N8WQH9_9GLOM|nr:10058_t:CDS:2 [Paraglomus occultum]
MTSLQQTPQQPQPIVQHQSSTHMMKTTRSGRPFAKDIHDLYAALMVSLPMDTHRHMFRSYPHSFTTEEAINNLGSLKFTQSHRSQDARDPLRILFENVLDSSNRSFKDKCLYSLTSKGLYVLEHFITKNLIASNHLTKLFAAQAAPIKLFYLERTVETDSLVLNKQTLVPIFRRFAGQRPNLRGDRNLGIELREKSSNRTLLLVFQGGSACDWLCDFTTVVTREEAVKVFNEFLRNKLVEPIPDKRSSERRDNELRYSKTTFYRLSEEGQRIAGWDILDITTVHTDNGSNRNKLKELLSYGNIRPAIINKDKVADRATAQSLLDKEKVNTKPVRKHRNSVSALPQYKESNNKKLQQILEDQTLSTLFMDFLKSKLCEENLLFLLDIKQLKQKYSRDANEVGEIQDPMEKQRFIADAFRIYNTFLAPGSANELNIDHTLRQHYNQIITTIVSLDADANTSEVPKSVVTINLFNKIEDTIFRLMASDSVPKFIRTESYIATLYGRQSHDTVNINDADRTHRHTNSLATTAHDLAEPITVSGEAV